MPGLYYMRLKPYEWIQSLANYGGTVAEGRRLTAKARIEPGHKLILTSGEDISALNFELHIFDDEPAKINKESLEHGFGLLDYFRPLDGDVEFDSQPAFIGGWFCISPDSYKELWDQIRQGRICRLLYDFFRRSD